MDVDFDWKTTNRNAAVNQSEPKRH